MLDTLSSKQRSKRDAEHTKKRYDKSRECIRKIRLRVYIWYVLFRRAVKLRAPARSQQLRICAARMPPSAVAASLRPPGLPLPESLREVAVADGMVLQIPGLSFHFSNDPTSTLLVETFGTLQLFRNRRDTSSSDCLDDGDEGHRLVHPEEMELTVTIFSSARAYHGRGDPGAAPPPSGEHAMDATGLVFKMMMTFTPPSPPSEGLGPSMAAGATINLSDFGWLGNSTRALDLSQYLHSPSTGRSRGDLLPPGGPAFDLFEPEREPPDNLLIPRGQAFDLFEPEREPPGDLLIPGGPAVDLFEPEREPVVQLLHANGPNLSLLDTVDEEPASGAFADLRFFTHKTTGEVFALKTAEDTPEGIKNILAEINILREVIGSAPRHIVKAIETRATPVAMILTKAEPRTLRCIGDSPGASNAGDTVKVLDGVLTAIEFLSSEGFLHRDIRPENIHVSGDGEGLLADFGLCTHKEIAVLPWQIGAGTPEYQATEVATTGSSLCSELFAVSVCFLEMMLSRNPFDGKALRLASERRRSYLEGVRKELLHVLSHHAEDGNYRGHLAPDHHMESQNNEREALAEASSRLENTRRTEWLLGIRSDEWRPDAEALSALARTEVPLEVYVVPSQADTRSREIKENWAGVEAKSSPRKVFEAADWTEWLPGTTRVPCTKGLRKIVSLVVEKGMLDPNPGGRPQTTAALQGLLHEALRLYETTEAEGE
ncbi:serine/threonine protein kinase, putative [Ectocarpus siliculosus]|uniref:Serine/threonine protein kinase, putative n=1 Tax=Ectocarpus siliculosus TaxID=2880 RepID=D7FLV9_ECTSI|nr:serine/threonine protein kinase, putative [Ectocarpus siliculosus]|eukprot:CBJ29795.1 serine/threonine protein kinase, putative [Ectocarpus siliculosus]